MVSNNEGSLKLFMIMIKLIYYGRILLIKSSENIKIQIYSISSIKIHYLSKKL